MKRKDKEQLHAATVNELKSQLVDITKKFTELVVGKQKQQSRNTHTATKLRKKRAVILTILREKELTA